VKGAGLQRVQLAPGETGSLTGARIVAGQGDPKLCAGFHEYTTIALMMTTNAGKCVWQASDCRGLAHEAELGDFLLRTRKSETANSNTGSE
jgi:hypothetical protein